MGDSIADNLLGYDNTIPVTLDEMIVAARSVARATRYAMVVADLPFGSYEASPAMLLYPHLECSKNLAPKQ